MNIQYRKATIEDLYEIMELIKFAVFTMENSGKSNNRRFI